MPPAVTVASWAVDVPKAATAAWWLVGALETARMYVVLPEPQYFDVKSPISTPHADDSNSVVVPKDAVTRSMLATFEEVCVLEYALTGFRPMKLVEVVAESTLTFSVPCWVSGIPPATVKAIF